MFGSTKLGLPGQFKREGSPEYTIGLRILLAPDAISSYIYPRDNRAGTVLLYRLLRAQLELAELQVSAGGALLELNGSYYTFAVSNLEVGLQTLKAELQEVGLLNGAQIAWYDQREGVFRVWHSRTGRFDMPSEKLRDSEQAVITAMMAAARATGNPAANEETDRHGRAG